MSEAGFGPASAQEQHSGEGGLENETNPLCHLNDHLNHKHVKKKTGGGRFVMCQMSVW